MDDHRLRAEQLGRELRLLQLRPRIGGPDSLGDDQARRMDGEDRHLVVLREPLQRVWILAHRVRPDHHLDAVVAELGGQLERDRGALGIHGRRGQADLRTRRPQRSREIGVGVHARQATQ
jgi:hypothetical protein